MTSQNLPYGSDHKNIFFLKSTPQDGHFEVLIIHFGSETKEMYTKTYFDHAV